MSSDLDDSKKGHSSGTTKNKHRSRSSTRHNNDKPRKKRHASATSSFASIPNAIKLSMLNSGLLPTSKFNSKYNYFTCIQIRFFCYLLILLGHLGYFLSIFIIYLKINNVFYSCLQLI